MLSPTTAPVRRKVPGDPLRGFDDDYAQLNRYTQQCMEDRHASMALDPFELDAVRDEESVKLRRKIIEGYRKRLGFPINTIEMDAKFVKYNSIDFGIQLSNVLTGYLIGHKVKIPQVDHKVYTGSGIMGFEIYKTDMNCKPIDKKYTDAFIASFEAAIMQWLDQSELQKFLTGDSVEQRGVQEQNRDLLVVRRSMIVDVDHNIPVSSELNQDGKPQLKSAGHTLLFFWQAVKTTGDDLIEHGVADNLYDDHYEEYYINEGLNIDFYELFDEVFKNYCRRHIGRLADEMEMVGLQNNIPATCIVNKTYNLFNLSCFTLNRRMLIYFSLLYNVNNVNLLVEHAKFDEAYNDVYLIHKNLYIHHMDRMMQWLLTSPLIWPTRSQKGPTKSRPCCIVRLCRPFEMSDMTYVYKRDKERSRLCVELNEETACLDLYNPVQMKVLKYWFKWDGQSAFSLKEYYDERCAVQAAMDALTERVKALEASMMLPEHLLSS